MPHTLVLDIGKTHKKCYVFNESFQVLFEQSDSLPQTTDEDGHSCEDIRLLTEWIRGSYTKLCKDYNKTITHVNCSAYGASLVFIDDQGKTLTPLYDYHKPYPKRLEQLWENQYGDRKIIDLQTASPSLGSLNSAMQLFRLKHDRPKLYEKLHYALHLPQFVTWVLTGKCYNELSSLGCHSRFWDFSKGNYHQWVFQEGFDLVLPPPRRFIIFPFGDKSFGSGVHDSSAAVLPYLRSFDEPFILLSTGTWNIALNPFNDGSLTQEDLNADCLYYLTPEGKQVKAARLLAGPVYDEAMAAKASGDQDRHDLLTRKLIEGQVKAIQRVLTPSVKTVFVDGGFAKNIEFLNQLSVKFPDLDWYISEIAQATALGTAVLMHPAISVRNELRIHKI